MDKYYFNNIPIQDFSEPKPNNSFRDGKFWIKTFVDKEVFANEKKILEALSSCEGVVKAEECGKVSIVSKDGKTGSFDAIKEWYVKGKDIRTYCKKHYEESELIVVFSKLAICMSEIESLGVIHNDIKPQNILVTGNDEPILIDFGTSKFINEETLPVHTRFTIGFCSPEKRAAGSVSVKSDIYSFGCVLYACMCQHPQWKTTYSKALFSIKNKCCMEEPKSRYDSFDEIAKDLLDIEDEKCEGTVTESRFIGTDNIFERFKNYLKQHSAVFLSIPLYGSGLFFLLLAFYMIARGPSKPNGYIPKPKEDIQFVINDIKNKHNQMYNEKNL